MRLAALRPDRPLAAVEQRKRRYATNDEMQRKGDRECRDHHDEVFPIHVDRRAKQPSANDDDRDVMEQVDGVRRVGERPGRAVWSVEDQSTGSTTRLWVSLLIPADAQEAVAQAAADDLLRLSLKGGAT